MTTGAPYARDVTVRIAAEAPPASGSRSGAVARVLVVDATGVEFEALARALERAGENSLQVTRIPSAVHAASLVALDDWDCVVLCADRADPPQLAHLAAGIGSVGSPPVILIARDESAEAARTAIRHGAHDYLPRESLEGTAFARAVRSAIERARLRLGDAGLRDPLTGLPNRLLLIDRLRRALLRLDREQINVAVGFLDLDGFKSINDRFGHAAGDTVLTVIAHRLERVSRASDTVARLAGDEFALVYESTGLVDLTRIATRLTTSTAAPIALGEQGLVITASIGIAVAAPHDRDPATMLARADAAMYRAKSRPVGDRIEIQGPD